MSVILAPGFTGITYPLSHPRIAAFSEPGTISVVGGTAAGFDPANAADGKTWTFWKPTGVTAEYIVDMGATRTISYFGIAGHNLATVGGTVQFFTWTGSAWQGVVTHAPTDNDPILLLLSPRSTTRYRFAFLTAVPTVAVLAAGAITEFPQKAEFVGGLPFDEAEMTEYRDTVSDGGHVLERFATRKAVPAEMVVNHLPEAWVSGTLLPLQRHMESKPVFMADRPGANPQSLVFGMAPDVVQARRALANANVSRNVTIRVNGHRALW